MALYRHLPSCRAASRCLTLFLCLAVTCCDGQVLRYRVAEEAPRDTFLADLASDGRLTDKYTPEELAGAEYTFSPSDSSREMLFTLSGALGSLSTARSIDRDVICPYMVNCDIKLSVLVKAPQIFEILVVTVTVIDINDNAPLFSGSPAVRQYTFKESASVGTSRSLPIADDPDGPPFGVQRYELFPTDTFGLEGSGEQHRLVLKAPLDRERRDSYILMLVAMDGGTPPRNGSLRVEVRVDDANDNSPAFDNSSYEAVVREDAALNTLVLRVHAHDPDEGENGQVVYGFTDITEAAHSDKFRIDPDSGEILVTDKLDFESEESYTLYVTANNPQSLPNSVAARATVTVRVLDLNDNAPEIVVSGAPLGNVSVPENKPNGTYVTHITVNDPDSGIFGQFDCDLDSPLFRLRQAFTDTFVVEALGPLDRETQDSYNVTFKCRDRGSERLMSSKQLYVRVTDENDQAPFFNPATVSVSIEEGSPIGTRVTTIAAFDDDVGQNARVNYSITNISTASDSPGRDDLSGLFLIDPDKGVITTNAPLEGEGRYELTVWAEDGGEPPLSGTALVTVLVTRVEHKAPVFSSSSGFDFAVPENKPPDTRVGRVTVLDDGGLSQGTVTYSIEPQPGDTDHHLFSVGARDGVVTSRAALDRETRTVYRLVVSARSTTSRGAASSTTDVRIRVTDVNDHSPVLVYPGPTNNTLYVDPATVTPGDIVAQLMAYDEDATVANRVCRYALVLSDPLGPLRLHANGTLTTRDDLTRLFGDQLRLDVAVYDCGEPRRNATGTLVVHFSQDPVVVEPPPAKVNLIIVIVTVLVTVAVTTVLALLIFYVVRHKRRMDRRYNWMARMADKRIRERGPHTEISRTPEDQDHPKAAIVSGSSSGLDGSDPGEDNDAVKVALGLGFGLNDVPDEAERTIEGQESRPRDINVEHRRNEIPPDLSYWGLAGASTGGGLPYHSAPASSPEASCWAGPSPVGPRYDGLQQPEGLHGLGLGLYYYQNYEHTVRKPAVFNPNPAEQRPSPSGESESLYSGGDSGRGSAVSDQGSPSGRRPFPGPLPEPVLPPARPSTPPVPPVPPPYNLPTWELSPGIHIPELSPGVHVPGTSVQPPFRVSPTSSQSTPVPTLERVGRHPQVRFTLPPELASLTSTTCSDDCLNEKQI